MPKPRFPAACRHALFPLFAVLLSLPWSAPQAAEPWHSASQMSRAATALLAILDEGQRQRVTFPLDDTGRTTWSNLPIIMVQPGGLLLREMNEAQRGAVHDLLRASMSSQGYAKFAGIMRLEDIAHEEAVAALERMAEPAPMRRAFANAYDSLNYAVSVFGAPGSARWGWKIAGHHAAANFTVADGRVGFTPTFLGSHPMQVSGGKHAGWMTLPHEGSRGLELMAALDAEQRGVAIIGDEKPADVIEGPGRRASLGKYEGLRADRLTPPQKNLLRVLVAEYVHNTDFDTAAAQMERIEEAGWDTLWFSWRGPVDPAGRFYYRVHGPRILIEYSRQNETTITPSCVTRATTMARTGSARTTRSTTPARNR
jgi:hypothetical protein